MKIPGNQKNFRKLDFIAIDLPYSSRRPIIPFFSVLDKPKHFFNGVVIEIVPFMNRLLTILEGM